MTRGRYCSIAMPVAGILYVLALILSGGNGTVAVVGALAFALIAVVGTALGRGTPSA